MSKRSHNTPPVYELIKEDGTVVPFNVVAKRPPIWDELVKKIGEPPDNVVFTYGLNIFNPSNKDIPYPIIEHEKIHMAQQQYSDIGAGLWWAKYLDDPIYRLNQEIEGYAMQYIVYCNITKDREKRHKMLHDIFMALSSDVYGKIIDYDEARKRIKELTS